MADLLDEAVGWLDEQREANLSRLALYQRGSQSVQIAATPGSTAIEIADDAGATVQSRQSDFIVSAGALVLDGMVIIPRVGDRIRIPPSDSSDKTLVYEVLALPDGRHFQRCDGSGRMLRIHARLVDEEQT